MSNYTAESYTRFGWHIAMIDAYGEPVSEPTSDPVVAKEIPVGNIGVDLARSNLMAIQVIDLYEWVYAVRIHGEPQTPQMCVGMDRNVLLFRRGTPRQPARVLGTISQYAGILPLPPSVIRYDPTYALMLAWIKPPILTRVAHAPHWLDPVEVVLEAKCGDPDIKAWIDSGTMPPVFTLKEALVAMGKNPESRSARLSLALRLSKLGFTTNNRRDYHLKLSCALPQPKGTTGPKPKTMKPKRRRYNQPKRTPTSLSPESDE